MLRKAAVIVLLALVPLGAAPSSVDAGLGRRCRLQCGAAIDQCHSNGERRRRCKRRYVRLCKTQGLAACELTPPTTSTTLTTTTSPPTTFPPTTSRPTTTTSRPTTTTSTTLPTRLSVLLGRWAFTYTIISTFTDHYNLTTIEPAPDGSPYDIVTGFNIDFGNTVIAARVQDLNPGDTTGYEFAMLDPESSALCEFFAFNVAGASSATGVVLYFYGDCQTPVSGIVHNFAGTKY
jgi:hypothetical protein